MRRLFRVSGVVQGVGFRPFVFNLACTFRLGGRVYNDGEGVLIEVEGEVGAVEDFARALLENPPVLARIDKVETEILPTLGYRDFSIAQSHGVAKGKALLPPDIATCPECRKELADPGDRHHQYPFVNCTNCGPRFTIVHKLPYDRQQTAMSTFPMCTDCTREYWDSVDRRFHAQPVACPACGPQMALVDRQGQPVTCGDWLVTAARLLQEGHMLGIKGLGGFHLACDATNLVAIAELRRRKGRPAKPLAVMCRDLETAAFYCHVAPVEAQLLQSPAAPIVLLRKKTGCPLPAELAPGLSVLGVMLPYTPLHLLLVRQGPPVLVMTSGNRSGMPLVKDNEQALEELGDMADYFLWHNRDIINRCDDSVTAVVNGKVQFLRRSRGYVPQPLAVPLKPNAPVVLGIGGEMKNAFCLVKEGRAFLSQHMGEIDTLEGQRNLEQSVEAFCRLIGIEPEVVTCDLHPQYNSSRLAAELASRLGARLHPGVQHHHAHLASCLAENGVENGTENGTENGIEGEVIGIILDGTGYGLDGGLWGFEVMRGDFCGFTREYHLAHVPLPGGQRAVRQPWLTAAAYLITFLGERGLDTARRFFPERQKELSVVKRMLESGFNTPPASSCGRFFDAVAALLGLCCENTYEGQAAILLGDLAPWFPSETTTPEMPVQLQPYPFNFEGCVINPAPVLTQVIKDIENAVSRSVIARQFHDTIIAMVVEAAQRVREKTGLSAVALSGGTWHNRYLSAVAGMALREQGFTVLSHHLVPPGDGGIALGQAMIAAQNYNDH